MSLTFFIFFVMIVTVWLIITNPSTPEQTKEMLDDDEMFP